MEVGIDIAKISRFDKMINNEKSLTKLFNENEINYIKSKGIVAKSTLAGLYCAKEAVLKAVGCGINGNLAFKDISIVFNNFGKPFVELNDKILKYLALTNSKRIKVSISHDGDYAISECIIF